MAQQAFRFYASDVEGAYAELLYDDQALIAIGLHMVNSPHSSGPFTITALFQGQETNWVAQPGDDIVQPFSPQPPITIGTNKNNAPQITVTGLDVFGAGFKGP